MGNRSVSLSVFALLLLLLASPAPAATVFVDAASVTGVEDGTAANPFRSIPPALTKAAPGDTVLVRPGIYYGAIELANDVKLVGEKGPEVTIIDGMGVDWVVQMPYSPTPRGSIEGFTVRNGTILFFATNRVNFWGGNYLTVDRCILTDAGAAFSFYPASSVTVSRTLAHNLTAYFGYAIWCSPPRLVNVTVDQCANGMVGYQTGYSLTNCSLTNMPEIIRVGRSSSLYGSNNNLWGYQNLFTTWHDPYSFYNSLTTTLEQDPLFVAPPADYRLQACSPLIDAGVDVGFPYSGAAPDIGALEYVNLDLTDLAGQLAESYQAVPLPAFKNVGEQRRNALEKKFAALVGQLQEAEDAADPAAQAVILLDARAKLVNDIWAKADGFYGGNPNNDWVTTKEEQDRIYPRVQELLNLIDSLLADAGA